MKERRHNKHKKHFKSDIMEAIKEFMKNNEEDENQMSDDQEEKKDNEGYMDVLANKIA